MLMKKISSLSLVAALAVALLTAVGVSPARAAATDGTADTAFDTNVGTTLNAAVVDVAEQEDGKVLAGGWFSNRVARFKADGTPDDDFNTNAANAITGSSGQGPYPSAILVQDDGKIVVGGYKLTDSQESLMRLNPDGTRDLSFTESVNNEVMTLAQDASGNILAGGHFTSPGQKLARLDKDGNSDAGFNNHFATGVFNSYVWDVAVKPNGKIAVSGAFSLPADGIAQFNSDGTPDTTFNDDVEGARDTIYKKYVVATPNNDVIVGGHFTSPGVRIARFTDAGATDTTFNGNVGSTFSSKVQALAVQADGKVLAGNSDGVYRFNSDGTPDTTFNGNVAAQSIKSVKTLATQADGQILVGGSNLSSSLSSHYLMRLNSAAPPLAPVLDSVTAGDSAAVLSWTAPTSDGGADITDYEYRLDGSGGWTSLSTTGTSATVTGLTNDTTYAVEIRAVNGEGSGAASNSVNFTPVATLPGAPVLDSVTAGDSSAVLSWTAPTSDGGADITDYEYRLDGSGGWTSLSTTGTSATVTGLTNDTTYAVEVRAVNSAGNGAASNSVNVTPAAPAPAPAAPAAPASAAPAPEASTPSQPAIAAPLVLLNAQKVLTKLKRQLKQGRDSAKLLRLKLKLGGDANARPTEIRWRFKMAGSQNKQRAKNGWASWRSVAVAPSAQRVRLDFADAGKVRKALTGKFADNSPVKLQVRGVNAAGDGPMSSVRLKPATRAATLPANG